MKTVVIYNSQTAEWIASATDAECIEFSEAKEKYPKNILAVISDAQEFNKY